MRRLTHRFEKPRVGRIVCFRRNPAHPSLRFKKLGGLPDVWSVRIAEQYRAVGERHGDKITWAWIGSHNDFDKLFG